MMNECNQVFDAYGYEPIETPTFEFLDVFGSEVGTAPSNELFKFFDRDGRTLALRPDFTPSIARTVSAYFDDVPRPLRLCYEGSTFVNSSEYQGRLKESTQMGVEMIGDGSAEADAEIIALTIDCLKKVGLSDFQLSIGEVNLIGSLIAEGNLTTEQTEELRRLLIIRNVFGIEDLLDGTTMSAERRNALIKMPALFGGPEVLKTARDLAVGARCHAAIDRLENIYGILEKKDMARYISFDFGTISRYRYYTGIIFSAFTYGSGEPVAKGGRYDSLLGQFGKDEAAVGVGLAIDQLAVCLNRSDRSGK